MAGFSERHTSWVQEGKIRGVHKVRINAYVLPKKLKVQSNYCVTLAYNILICKTTYKLRNAMIPKCRTYDVICLVGYCYNIKSNCGTKHKTQAFRQDK